MLLITATFKMILKSIQASTGACMTDYIAWNRRLISGLHLVPIPVICGHTLLYLCTEINFICSQSGCSAGKTTMVEKLTQKLNGQKMSTPPTCLHSLRDQFDGQPTVLRRAYYSLGNYIAAHEVEKLVKSCPVVMDRLVAFKVLVIRCFCMMNPHKLVFVL
jgi:hypothetical protein